MAALDFPASPTLNQVYSANGRSWIWDGAAWNPYGSGIADGDRGDITVSSGGSQWTIDPETVTYAKMQNVSAASRLLGRGSASGAGDVEELTVGTGLSISGTTLSCTVTDTGITQLTGDVTAGPGNGSQAATIANDAVSNAKLANMAEATLKGRAAGAGTGDPTDLSATQATAILNAFVGDSGAGGTKGLVPAPAAGDAAAGKYLDADGTWTVPAGGGGSAPTFAEVASDVAITDNTTLQSITGLSFSVAANTKYRIDFVLSVTTSAGTTGYEVGLTGPASPTRILADVTILSAQSAFVSTLTNGTSYGSIAANLNGPSATPRACRGTIFFTNGANAGTLQLQGKVETAVSGTVTFQAGSAATITELA